MNVGSNLEIEISSDLTIANLFCEIFESTCLSHWDLDSLMKILIFSIASKKVNEMILRTQKPEETFIHILSKLYKYYIFNKQELDKLLIIIHLYLGIPG